jgi:hypothetical protein
MLLVLCCAVLCCAVLCCAVLCCAVLCCAVLCCAVQLSEESLLQLAELGYSHKSASRALRFSGGNLQQAVDFLDAQQEKKQVSSNTGSME